MIRSRFLLAIGLALVVGALVLPSIGAPAAPTSMTRAADLRVTLNNLLTEHTALAASATLGALTGNTAEFRAAAAQLDANSDDIIRVVGSVYGPDAQRAFDPLWKKHIGFVVDYTTGLATNNKAKQDKAVQDLLAYTQEFGAFLNSATKSLPTDAVAGLVREHILTLKAVIDAQKAGKFPGSATGAAVDLRTSLNTLLSEHVYLAARATGAALRGNMTAFRAAATALDANSNDIIRAVGSVYGPDAQRAFDPLWKKHIGFVVDYTTGLATNNKAKQDKAVQDLLAYTQEFGAFLNSATKSLPTDAVAGLVREHILTLKAVIDAQKAGNQPAVYTNLRKAMGHMQMVADPLAEAIVKQFPDRFR
jgi:uncharacterized protein (DUF885 family)